MLILIDLYPDISIVSGKVIPHGTRVLNTTSSPIQQPQQKVLIRSVQPKTIIPGNNVIKIGTQATSESPSISTFQPSLGVQKIVTSTGQLVSGQQTHGTVISSQNFQNILQRGNITPGQKIVVQSGLGGVQKLLVSSSSSTTTTQAQQPNEKRIIFQNVGGQPQQYILQNQSNLVPQQQQFVTIGGQKLILQTSGSSNQLQQFKTITSPVQQQQQPQQIQFQIQNSTNQQSQQQETNGSNIAQQMIQGKIQVMNLNGQQVLVKSLGSNQSIIVGQVKTSVAQQTPVKPTVRTTLVSSQNQQIVKNVQISSGESSSVVESTQLAGHPPGTVVKCVTAQVMQTPNGPRIVLQGLQGSDISPQQSQALQQQVKQQLMKGN